MLVYIRDDNICLNIYRKPKIILYSFNTLWSSNDYLEGLNFDDGRVLLDEQVGRVTTVIQDHVGLPVLTTSDTFIDAPPVDKESNILLNSILQ